PTRKIQVTLNTQALVGYYQFTQTTNVNPTAASNFDFISFTTDTAFTFFNFSNIDSVYVNAHLSGAHNELITIPVQTITRKGKNYEVSGSGKAMPDAKTLQINFIQKELDIINPIIQTGVTTYHRVYF
ncbi:MAG: hypothetical protein IT239_01620, partial [Bacteroidia bacterium]|nr:hypothetical protein [Bacteroidia bacterium]